MRLFIAAIAALLASSSPSLAATYEFDLVSGQSPSQNSIVIGYIDLAAPASGQDFSLNLVITNPDGSPYLLAESISGESFVQSAGGSILFSYTGRVDSLHPCPTGCNGLLPSPLIASIADGTTRLFVDFNTQSFSDSFAADFTLTVPDRLQPSVFTAVPESSTWAMMLIGFALISLGIKKRHSINQLASVTRA